MIERPLIQVGTVYARPGLRSHATDAAVADLRARLSQLRTDAGNLDLVLVFDANPQGRPHLGLGRTSRIARTVQVQVIGIDPSGTDQLTHTIRGLAAGAVSVARRAFVSMGIPFEAEKALAFTQSPGEEGVVADATELIIGCVAEVTVPSLIADAVEGDLERALQQTGAGSWAGRESDGENVRLFFLGKDRRELLGTLQTAVDEEWNSLSLEMTVACVPEDGAGEAT